MMAHNRQRGPIVRTILIIFGLIVVLFVFLAVVLGVELSR